MEQIDPGSYKKVYLQTAREYIYSLLVGYDKLVSDFQDKDAVNQIYIDSHSLRTQSQVMRFTDIADLSGNIEKISKDILDGVVEIDDKFISFLKTSITKLNLRLDEIAKGDPSPPAGGSG